MTHTLRAVYLGAAITLGAALSCESAGGGGDGSPFAANQQPPQKKAALDGTPVAGILAIDAEKENPLNALAYTIETADGTAPLFNYVILSYAYLVKERGYTRAVITPALRAVLENGAVYIKPLHQKGIQVLVEVRGGIYAAAEDGVAAGFGVMDMTAMDEFKKELKHIVDAYGIDGFYLNDVGSGKNAYPPRTRHLKQFLKDEPLYETSLFKKKINGTVTEEDLTAEEIEAILWREGGSNFSTLIEQINAVLKEEYTSYLDNGAGKTETVVTQINRVVMVSAQNHGAWLLHNLRNLVDAYTGADPTVPGNIRYVIYNNTLDVTNAAHPSFYDENDKQDAGAMYDRKYAPFAIDLQNRLDSAAIKAWAAVFLGNKEDRYNRYGALFFKNLPPALEQDSAAYISQFTRVIFNEPVSCSGGNWRKDW